MQDKGVGTDNISITSGIVIVDRAKWRSKWFIQKYDKNMRLYDSEKIDGNLLLNEGIAELLTLLIGGGATAFNNANAHIGIGDGTTAASAAQTGLVGANKKYKPMDATFPKVENQKVIFRSTFGPDDANHAWREFTVANGSSDSAKNLNRRVEAGQRSKANPDTWVIQLEITIS